MSKLRQMIGTDGRPLPMLPPQRDARVWAKLVRVMFYTPGFLAMLLLKAGEPTSFGITVELLMLASAAAVVGGLFIGSESEGSGADVSSKTGAWSGALVLELLGVVPFLCAVPPLFHELANSNLLHARVPGAVDVSLGASELLPAMAILPFMLYQLAGFGTLHFVVSKQMNRVINIGILGLVIAVYSANRLAEYSVERALAGLLILSMGSTVLYGVLKFRKLQMDYDLRCPDKDEKDKQADHGNKNHVLALQQ
jgi:hypothetical protein